MAARDNLDRVNDASESVRPKQSVYLAIWKRVLDLTIAIPCFIVTLPINAVLAIAVYKDVGSPVFFKQSRLGKNNKPFNLYKFRSMTNETDDAGNLLPAAERTTKVGQIIRKYSLDELSNFWFIIKGDIPSRILKTRQGFSLKKPGAFALPANVA